MWFAHRSDGRASSVSVVHGADLSCASPLFSLSSLTLHPPTPSVIPSCQHTGSLFSDLSLFFRPLHYPNHQSHHSCACKTPPLLSVAVSFPFPLISPSFIPLFSPFWAHFVHSPTRFLPPPPFPLSPNLALTCVCLLISKCFLPSHLFSPGVANQFRFCLY